MKEEITLQVLTLAMLASKGIKVARLAGNRDFSEKNIKEKKKSLKKCGMLSAAIIISAKKALDEGLEVVDFETGKAITYENADKYVVLVDANHRFKAYLELRKSDDEYKGDFYVMYPLQENISIAEMLAEINVATDPWKSADYGKGAAMVIKEKLPLLEAINELTAKGYSLDSTVKWLTFSNKVTKSVLANAMNGQISEALRKENGIERGRKLIAAAKKSFAEDFLKSRNLPDWIISKADDFEGSKAEFEEQMSDFLGNIDRERATDIEKTKGTRGGDTKEAIINRKLNALWSKKAA